MIHLSSDPLLKLPTAEELPHSDDTPVDNELQNDIPNFILNLFRLIWEERQDWFFGVDMAVHYQLGTLAIVPDGFLAVGVPRHESEGGRLSYVLWQEGNIMPILALEVISENYNGEYEKKLETYQDMGILYYAIYNPLIRKNKYKDRLSLEVYKLVDDRYQPVPANEHGIVWMPEISVGMGCEVRSFATWEREWLYLYDQSGDRYLTADEIAVQERLIALQERMAKQQAEQNLWQAEQNLRQAEAIALQERIAKQEAEQQAQRLAEQLRAMGIDPDDMQDDL